MCPSVRAPPSDTDRRSPEDLPLPAIHRHEFDRLADADNDPPADHDRRQRPGQRHPTHRDRAMGGEVGADAPPFRPLSRAHERDPFKCGRCRAFIGPTVSGGRHRNHCPLCLTSRHVDARRPGDRASPCRALMAPVGTFFRPKGEQVVLHRCNGCDLERHARVAADDDPVALLRLPLVAPRLGGRRPAMDEAIA